MSTSVIVARRHEGNQSLSGWIWSLLYKKEFMAVTAIAAQSLWFWTMDLPVVLLNEHVANYLLNIYV